MRSIRTLLLTLSALVAPTMCHAGIIPYFLTTGQTGPDTQIDVIDSDSWRAPSITAPPNDTVTWANYVVSDFDATFNWYFGGGDFKMKAGPHVDVNSLGVTLALYQDNLDGAPLASAHVAGTAIDGGDYTYTAFHFASPYELVAGGHYIVTLTSGDPHQNADSYFIKDAADFTIINSNNEILAPPPDSGIPEPGTWILMASGLGLAVTSRLRGRKA